MPQPLSPLSPISPTQFNPRIDYKKIQLLQFCDALGIRNSRDTSRDASRNTCERPVKKLVKAELRYLIYLELGLIKRPPPIIIPPSPPLPHFPSQLDLTPEDDDE
jgi:hypothetical protein